MELWHYTSLSSCLAILKSQELWLSRIVDTNDETDCDWSRQILSGYFYLMLEKKVSTRTKLNLISSGKSVKKTIQQEVQNRLDITFNSLVKRHSTKVQSSKFDHYIFCLSDRCEKNGDNGILSMWRGYGGKEPVSIVFDEEILKSTIEACIVSNKHQVIIDKVTYAKDSKDILAPLKKELEEIQSVFEDEAEPVKGPITKEFYTAVAMLAFMVKHYGFLEESRYPATI